MVTIFWKAEKTSQ